jgi:polyhydroxybutyrate depolymerase
MQKVRAILLGIVLVAVIAAAVVASTGSGSAPASTGPCRPGDRMLRFSVDGVKHEALLHVPRGASGRMPLVVAFHGAYDDARGASVYYGLSKLAGREHFAVLYPQASHDKFWELRADQHEDVEQVRVLLDRVESAPCIDSSRVYATGVSNGGGFTARLGCEMANRLAAIAPVAGGYGRLGDCHPDRPVPMLEIHGTKDRVVPYRGTGSQRRGSDSGFVSVSRFLREWTRLDGCLGEPELATPQPGITHLTWNHCAGRSVVEHLKLAGAEHGWPGPAHDPTGLDTAEAVWDFLSRFRLPSSAGRA